MMRVRRFAAAFCAAAAMLAAAEAHHSWARYDGDHVMTITGVVTNVEWASPHVFMNFTAPNDSGAAAEWTMEMDPPTLLSRYGLRHDTITAGMTITITGVRARSGARMMRAVTIERAGTATCSSSMSEASTTKRSSRVTGTPRACA